MVRPSLDELLVLSSVGRLVMTLSEFDYSLTVRGSTKQT